MKIISKSLEDTAEIAKEFIEKISMNYSDRAAVVGLYGDLGSGKTTFVQNIAKFLGVEEYVTSPTFVIEKIYPIKFPHEAEPGNPGFNRVNEINHKDFKNLIHIDAYRMDSAKEILAIGFEKILLDPKNLILIEWPERVREALPDNHAKVSFRFVSENEREIEI